MKSTSRLIKYFNTYKSHYYLNLQPLYKLSQHKFYNKIDTLSGNEKDKDDLLSKKIITTTANSTFQMLIKNLPQKKLFASEFLLALKEK